MLARLVRRINNGRLKKRMPELPHWAKEIKCDYRSVMDRHNVEGPVCHVGSRLNTGDADEAKVQRWRSSFAHLPNPGFVGIDIFEGQNVDVTADLCGETFSADHPELIGRFGLVLCLALLEHVKNPFLAARNINALLKPGGQLYFVGPWVWGYHAYPEDYWRISPQGLAVLFPDLKFRQWWYSSIHQGVGIEISDVARERKLFAQSSVTGAAFKIADRGLPYLNIGAILQKPA